MERENTIHKLYISDDRYIAYCAYGDQQGIPIFYLHGTPGSRYEPKIGDLAGKAHGFRIIAPDRPGIGKSDYQPDRKLLDWTGDVAQLADSLGFDTFNLIGVSGGGPYALACAYAIPERVENCVLLGSWGPVAEKPALWKAMAPLDRFFGRLSRSAPWTFYPLFSTIGWAAKNLSPEGFVKSLDSSLCEADRLVLEDEEMAAFFAADIVEAFSQGVKGPADDAMLLYSDWGFKISEIDTKTLIYHGEDDKFAPLAMASYLDQQLTNSSLEILPGQGHLAVMGLFERVFEQLAEKDY